MPRPQRSLLRCARPASVSSSMTVLATSLDSSTTTGRCAVFVFVSSLVLVISKLARYACEPEPHLSTTNSATCFCMC
jgi:hypothetical protein